MVLGIVGYNSCTHLQVVELRGLDMPCLDLSCINHKIICLSRSIIHPRLVVRHYGGLPLQLALGHKHSRPAGSSNLMSYLRYLASQ